MAITRINPSRNKYDNDNKVSYGYVIRVPSLPEAHAAVEGFTIFNEADDCFYRCANIVTSTRNYYEWKAVTFGASRAFLIPVGKLTELDRRSYSQEIQAETEKDEVGYLSKTLNEIIVGFRRFNVSFTLLGYDDVTTRPSSSSETYYYWRYNDVLENPAKFVDQLYYEAHKKFVGEVVACEDLEEAQTIYDDGGFVFTENTTIGWSDINKKHITAKLNSIIAKLNAHGANISEAASNDTYYRLCEITNDCIDEVNPFSIPWQLVLNRMWALETEVGGVKLQESSTSVTVEELHARTNFAAWFGKAWNNWVDGLYELTKDSVVIADKIYYELNSSTGEYTRSEAEVGTSATNLYEKSTLLYGSVAEAVHSTLKLLEFIDTKTGKLTDLTDIGASENLVTYINRQVARIVSLETISVNHRDGINQIRSALGEVGYMSVADAAVFENGVTYFDWINDLAKYVTLVAGTDYENGDTIGTWRSSHENRHVYTWVAANTAAALIAKNASDIATHEAHLASIDALLGTSLQEIKIENFDSEAQAGSVYYYWNNTTRTFTGLNVSVGDDLDTYRANKDYGPIFTACDATTACMQIKVNNNLIGRLYGDLWAKYNELKQQIIDEVRDPMKKLKDLAGIHGDFSDTTGGAAEPDNWYVDGYAVTTDTQFDEYRTYYKLTSDTGNKRFAELSHGTVAQYTAGTVDYVVPYYALTTDQTFQDNKTYYYKMNYTYYKGVAGTNYNVGDSVTLNTWYEYLNPTQPGTLGYDVYIRKAPEYVEVTEFIDSTTNYYSFTNPDTFEAHIAANATAFNILLGTYGKLYKKISGYEVENVHRGLIDRNTKQLESHRRECGEAHKTLSKKFDVLQDFVIQLTLNTIELILQEVATLTLIHQTVGRLIALHNALERLEGIMTFKVADGNYDSGYSYYTPASYKKSTDSTFQSGKVYFTRKVNSVSYVRADTWEEGKTYYYYKHKDRYIVENGSVSPAWPDDITKCYLYDESYKSWYEYMYITTSGSTKTVHTIDEEKIKEVINNDGYKAAFLNESHPAWYPIEGGVSEETFELGYKYVEDEETGDPVFPAEIYYGQFYDRVEDITYSVATVTPGETIVGDYYEATAYNAMVAGTDYEIGLEVSPNVFTTDLVIATTENYTLEELRMAVNRILRYHINTQELPEFTELPGDTIIQATLTYWRYIDNDWESIYPETDDPYMIGKTIRAYDPTHKWYLKMHEEIPEENYTETPVRIYLNELIKLHRRGTTTTSFSIPVV